MEKRYEIAFRKTNVIKAFSGGKLFLQSRCRYQVLQVRYSGESMRGILTIAPRLEGAELQFSSEGLLWAKPTTSVEQAINYAFLTNMISKHGTLRATQQAKMGVAWSTTAEIDKTTLERVGFIFMLSTNDV